MFSCCHLHCFQLFYELSLPSHTPPTYSNFGAVTLIRIHILILVSRCGSVRIASILPNCGLPFPITFAMCASQEQSFEISTPRYVYWSTIGSSSSPHFHLKFTGFTLSLLYTSIHTAHFFSFAVTLHFLLYSRDFCINFCFCDPSGVSDISTK